MIDIFDAKGITSEALGGLISALIIFILSLFVFDNKTIVKPWIYKLFNPIIGRYIVQFLDWVSKISTRVIAIIILLVLINLLDHDIILTVFVVLIAISFLSTSRKEHLDDILAKYSDSFDKSEIDTEKWEIVLGQPIIDNKEGRPQPSLFLNYHNTGLNSFILHKKINTTEGIIEFDFLLKKNSLINIVFLCDSENQKWYMARYDSRGGVNSDGFIRKGNPGLERNWNFFNMSVSQTSIDEWHRARLEFSSTRVSMYRDGELLVEFRNPEQFGKKIGLFNECGEVRIDNFSYKNWRD